MTSQGQYDLEFLFPPMDPGKRDAFLRERAEKAASLRAQGFHFRAASVEFDAKLRAYGVELLNQG